MSFFGGLFCLFSRPMMNLNLWNQEVNQRWKRWEPHVLTSHACDWRSMVWKRFLWSELLWFFSVCSPSFSSHPCPGGPGSSPNPGSGVDVAISLVIFFVLISVMVLIELLWCLTGLNGPSSHSSSGPGLSPNPGVGVTVSLVMYSVWVLAIFWVLIPVMVLIWLV